MKKKSMSLIAHRIATNLAEQEVPWDLEEDSWESDKNCILDNTGTITDSLCGLNKTNPNSIYIKGYFYFKGFKKYSLDMYIDTGASMCTANKHVIPEEFWIQAKEPIRARTANDDIMVMDKVAEQIQVQISGITFVIPTVYQVDTVGDITLGNNFCRLYEPFAQYKDTITFHINGTAVSIKKVLKAYFHGQPGFLDSKRVGNTLPTPIPENVTPLRDNFSYLFPGGEERTLDDTLDENSDAIHTFNSLSELELLLSDVCSEHPQDPAISKGKFEARIELIDSSKVIKVKPMQYTPENRIEFGKQITELLNLGVITKSKSPHFSPAFLVMNHSEKKRGKARMVINYKALNAATKGDGYLLPNKDQILQRIGGKKWFSSFDCKSGFWQVRLHPESQELTAFTCPQGHYHWKVMPFGLKQAPSIFQRHMDESFLDLTKFCLVYVDDILIFSDNESSHHDHVKQVLNRCKELGIILSEKKAQLCKTKIDFLGLTIDAGTLVLQRHIGEHLQEFPDHIQDRKSLERFLGTLNYISGYFPKIAQLRQPLQAKLKKEVQWTWTQMDSDLVRKIKSKIGVLPDLYNPGPEDQLIIETDASDLYWGGVLKARRPGESSELISRYCSGSFKQAEKNYHSNEKEILALIRTIKAFKAYLLPVRFIARTDNTNVKYFISTNISGDYKQARLVRWQQYLNYYNFEIVHIKGNTNVLADIMSRELYSKS
ncbi:polymerase polyprotein [Metaplexis yellow mottle-associated virus]|uniref:Enzymatic polyprotein n=1 Tax=Metaplexis yellow mottle-associated virus TaxID=2878269 RepID=A0A8K1M8U1_9VIRU|nr:polymerase polyprotein [Metaplexis yellow mottle-associated virus]UBN09112.1 polymerase polyprotein [Metaplexis yellow mottle-associated virus]